MYWMGTEGASAGKGGRDPRAIVVEVSNTNRNVKLRIVFPHWRGKVIEWVEYPAGFPRGPRAPYVIGILDARSPGQRRPVRGEIVRPQVGAEAVETIEIPELRLDQPAKVLARPKRLVVGHEHELARGHGAEAREQIGPQQPQHALVAAAHAESGRIDDHEVVVGLRRIARQAPKMFREVILRRVRQDAHLHAVQCGVAKRPG